MWTFYFWFWLYSSQPVWLGPFPPSHSFSRRSAFCFLFSMPTHIHYCLFAWAACWSRLGAGELHPGYRTWAPTVHGLQLWLSQNSCHAPLTNTALLSYLIWSLQYLLPLFCSLLCVFSINSVAWYNVKTTFSLSLLLKFKFDNISSLTSPMIFFDPYQKQKKEDVSLRIPQFKE